MRRPRVAVWLALAVAAVAAAAAVGAAPPPWRRRRGPGGPDGEGPDGPSGPPERPRRDHPSMDAFAARVPDGLTSAQLDAAVAAAVASLNDDLAVVEDGLARAGTEVTNRALIARRAFDDEAAGVVRRMTAAGDAVDRVEARARGLLAGAEAALAAASGGWVWPAAALAAAIAALVVGAAKTTAQTPAVRKWRSFV
jgi:hypothetical protein